MTAGRVKIGQATVSWGPRPYGPPMIIANAPVDNIDDLAAAVEQARNEIVREAKDADHNGPATDPPPPRPETVVPPN